MADRNFERSLSAVLKHEGGYVNHPNDPGGPTNKGVTLANFRAYVKPGGTIEDLKALTTAQTGVVYRRFYWDAVLAAELPDGIDYAVFDFAVNSGPRRAVQFLQRILGVADDGRVGPITLNAAKMADAATVINALCDKRLAWLKTLKTWGTFGRGWTSRVDGVRSNALGMAGAGAVQPPKPNPAPNAPPDAHRSPAGRTDLIFVIITAVLGAAFFLLNSGR